jgi:iron complex transport system substrate-binding protein
VERSSYESHPLGRMEWIKLYGLLLGKEKEAEQIFNEKIKQLEDLKLGDTKKTAVFFYITSSGAVNIRKPGDYVSKMIDIAGGEYIFSAEELKVDENSLSTMNIDLETFYAAAKDADYLIYSSTIEGELDTIEELCDKSSIFSDFKAVKTGNVWCTGQNMFQQTMGAADMISDLNSVFTDSADSGRLKYLHKLK